MRWTFQGGGGGGGWGGKERNKSLIHQLPNDADDAGDAGDAGHVIEIIAMIRKKASHPPLYFFLSFHLFFLSLHQSRVGGQRGVGSGRGGGEGS